MYPTIEIDNINKTQRKYKFIPETKTRLNQTDEINKVTRLTVIASDHPGLFSRIAGSVSIAGCSILNAIVNTRKDGLILDEFILQNKRKSFIIIFL